MAKVAAAGEEAAQHGTSGTENKGALGGEWARVEVEVPLAEMVGYSTALRSLTAGQGTFDMSFREYRQVDDFTAKKLIDEF